MNKKIVHKGKHNSRPLTIPRLRKIYNVIAHFDESSEYIITDKEGNIHNDQKDWNKLCGLKECYFKPKYNSIMVGWRWNPKTKLREFTAYSHSKGEVEVSTKILKTAARKITVKIDGEKGTISISYVEGGRDYTKNWQTSTKFKRGWIISHWFGGTSPAPQNISVYFNRTQV